MPRHILFVTGKLAEPSLRRMVTELSSQGVFAFDMAVLPITVAALATTSWIARHLQVPAQADEVVLPGLCSGDLMEIQKITSARVQRGPKDLRDLPEFFGQASSARPDYGAFDIEILAEINHAPQLTAREILQAAKKAKADGADVIDVGCDPGGPWSGLADIVKALRDEGLRVSVDTFDRVEAAAGAGAGAELILSVNGTNREAARDWGCGVVAVPDQPSTLDGLDQTIDFLQRHRIPFRVDPVLEPIAFGFAQSLGRYLEVRRRYPDVEMMMGVGNLTELTEVDSAGVNVLLLGFCQELGIRSVLTTEVINWCRSCVRELDFARRLVHFAITNRTLPKHLDDNLVVLRDVKLREHGEAALEELASMIKDRNVRLFAERGMLHAINDKMHLQNADPFELFKQMLEREPIDPAHAFYLGYELAKAVTALTLGKNYTQDQALRWGFLTRPEKNHPT